MEIFQFSGIGPNQIGFPHACLHKNEHNFYLLQYVRLNRTYYSGICTSKECKEMDLMQFLNKSGEGIEKAIAIYTGYNFTGQVNASV